MYARAFALEVIMVSNFDMNYKITMWATLTCMTLLCYTEIDAVIDTLWNIDCFFSCPMS